MSGESPSGYLMHSEVDLLGVAEKAVKHAKSLGAAAASALANENAGTTMKVRGGSVSSAIRDGGQSLSITVYDDGRVGRASSEALDDASLQRAVEHAYAIARQVEPDPDAGVADQEWLARDIVDVPMFAPSDRAPSELTRTALAIEAAALERQGAGDAKLRVDEAASSSSDMRWARAISTGFAGAGSASLQAQACVVIAERDGEMARDWWHVTARQECGLPALETVAHEAADRSLAKLGGRSLSPQSAPVLLDPRVAASLVQDVVGGLMGQAQQQRSTFLVDALGTKRLADHLDLTEDPFEPYGMASSSWDSEGVAGKQRHIVRGGVIDGYFLNVRTARKLGMTPTGNADGPSNLAFTSRLTDPDDDTRALLRKMGRGLGITAFRGGGVNAATGSYSKAVEGFWVEDGEPVHPVRDVTVAGELPTMLTNITAVGAECHRQGAIRTGSILIDNMRIAGR